MLVIPRGYVNVYQRVDIPLDDFNDHETSTCWAWGGVKFTPHSYPWTSRVPVADDGMEGSREMEWRSFYPKEKRSCISVPRFFGTPMAEWFLLSLSGWCFDMFWYLHFSETIRSTGWSVACGQNVDAFQACGWPLCSHCGIEVPRYEPRMCEKMLAPKQRDSL